MSMFDPPPRDPSVHWLMGHHVEWPEEDERPTVRPFAIDEYLADLRSDLAKSDTGGSDPPIYLPRARALAIAALLEESAARLRLDAAAGHPAASVPLAELAEELAEDLRRRPGRDPVIEDW
jgi:hypothetical protein